jgi:hypothetical protein
MFVGAIHAENKKKLEQVKKQWVRRVCPETQREYYVCSFINAKDNGGKLQRAESRWDSPFEKFEDGIGFEITEIAFGDLLLKSGVGTTESSFARSDV